MKRYIFLLLLLNVSCEETFIPVTNVEDEKYVVESYLELNDQAIFPYLILTKSLGFYSNINASVLEHLFIHNAIVNIETNQVQYPLQEICLNDIPKALQQQIADRFGLNLDSISVNFCVYIDINGQIPLQVGNQYKLSVIIGSDTLRSTTTIPGFIKIDSVWFDKIPGTPNDTFRQMFCFISDNPLVKDYYRYFTGTQHEPLIPNFSSVTDDALFNGQQFKFTLQKAQAPGSEFTATSGYYRIGDTVIVKWCNLDKEHFDFWNTLEVSRTRQGPFASYVRIDGNITNGLGIFGGQICKNYQLIVK